MATLSRLRTAALLVIGIVITGVLGYRFLEGYLAAIESACAESGLRLL